MAVYNSPDKDKDTKIHSKNNGKVLFIATVYTHLAAFHIPFMKMLQEKGYEVHAAASSFEGRKGDVERVGVACWEISFARSLYSPANIQAYCKLKDLLGKHYFDLIVSMFTRRWQLFWGGIWLKLLIRLLSFILPTAFIFTRVLRGETGLIYYTAERIASSWTDGCQETP